MILGIFKQSSLAVNVPATGCAMDYRLDNNGTSFILLSDSAYELSSTAPCSYLPIPEVQYNNMSVQSADLHNLPIASLLGHTAQSADWLRNLAIFVTTYSLAILVVLAPNY